ncbi:hypothetical protein HMPREF9446_00643 [Bacteroides fluxus YIT 12057]|uniref:Uncharacterized protein n=1 Tax=Bacteroides fluxus YIT 12057 TaxID=763034 RepID=F3PPJ3_9BACE|nr:hypothetical protein HMPREF9446_00643 [Bacteroides fluxus YIT 12057]
MDYIDLGVVSVSKATKYFQNRHIFSENLRIKLLFEFSSKSFFQFLLNLFSVCCKSNYAISQSITADKALQPPSKTKSAGLLYSK